MTATTAPQTDALGDVIEWTLKVVVVLAAMLIALPLVIPVVVIRIAGDRVATRTGFWVTRRGQTAIAAAGVILVIGLAVFEISRLVIWIHSGAPALLFADPVWFHHLVRKVLPWLVLNFTAGVLLVPAGWAIRRRRIADKVRRRRIADVVAQTRIETAIKRAADVSAARRIGVQLNPSTGKITGTTRTAVSAPRWTARGWAFGITSTTTTRKARDARTVRDWTDARSGLMVLPNTSSAVRALVIAESGSGKTVLLNDMVLCALSAKWPVFFLDAKGDPTDAEDLSRLARQLGATTAVGGAWDLFAGTADHVTAKLMRLMPVPDGANQHYLDEIRGVLQAVQHREPIRSVHDLRTRLTDPGDWVRDQHDLQLVNAAVDRNGGTAGTRALQALLVALRPLEAWIDPDGWTYRTPTADLTMIPLSPVDDAQARLGDLLLLDLRNFLAQRLTNRDKTPVLVVVDEFPQLITATNDPGDTAGSLFETARSAGVGLILATQSPAGLSNEEIRRRRALTSGAALIFGRSKEPEEIVHYAGTVMQMEAAGTATGDQLNSARAQHTYLIPPQDVREAADGAFWIIQGGAFTTFRAFPPPKPHHAPAPSKGAVVPQVATEVADTAEPREEEAA